MSFPHKQVEPATHVPGVWLLLEKLSWLGQAWVSPIYTSLLWIFHSYISICHTPCRKSYIALILGTINFSMDFTCTPCHLLYFSLLTLWSVLVMHSASSKGERLRCRRERERAHHAAETAVEKEQRLRQRRERDRARCAAQRVEERHVRLHRKSATEWERQAAETAEQRDTRLKSLRAAQQERLIEEYNYNCHRAQIVIHHTSL